MSKPILLLRLEGPLQSWGVRSRWDVRDTGLEPSKSGVIGLLGCALGYPMRDPRLEKLGEALRFGVRIENAGTLTTDYQTITPHRPASGDKAPATIISPRAYLEDAAFLVALEAKTESKVLEGCAAALQAPKWPLFLGRKACVPTRPIFEYFGEEYSDLVDALQRHQWQWLGAQKMLRKNRPKKPLVAFIEDEAGELTRQDVTLANTARTYGFRGVKRWFFDPVFADELVLEVP